jgi:hypothetical protein
MIQPVAQRARASARPPYLGPLLPSSPISSDARAWTWDCATGWIMHDCSAKTPRASAAYGARQFSQDLATGGRDVRSHHRRAHGLGGDFRPSHAAPSRRRASGHVDRQHHAEWRGTSGRTLAEPPIWRQARAAGIAASAPPNSYSVAPWRVDARARGHWPGLRRVAWWAAVRSRRGWPGWLARRRELRPGSLADSGEGDWVAARVTMRYGQLRASAAGCAAART